MKIVQLLPELNEGGVERGVVELSRELVKEGYESIVISNGGKLVDEIRKDGALHVKADVCSKNPITFPIRAIKLKEVLEKLKPDILHVRSRIPAWLVYFANKQLKIPVVSTVHGFNSVSFYSEIMTKADRVICVSNAIKEYIQKYYKTPNEKISVIPRGVDLERFNPDNLDRMFIGEFKKEYDLEGRFIISSVGRITQLKDLESFIKAVSLVQKELPDSIGLIVGGVREDKNEYFSTLVKLVDELKANVIFCGSQEKVAEIYALSDVVVSSSKKPESFGRSVAEALALNTPVIATNHGGVLDIIQEGVNGYFFEVGDFKGLSGKILESKDLRFDGYSYIKDNFSLDKMVKQTQEVYKNIYNEGLAC